MFASFNLSRTLAGAAGTLLFAGLCVGAATAPASAQSAPIAYGVNEAGERIAHVYYNDINIATAQGRALLENRVRIAARKVCSNDGQDVKATAAANRCYQNTVRTTRASAIAALTAEKVAG